MLPILFVSICRAMLQLEKVKINDLDDTQDDRRMKDNAYRGNVYAGGDLVRYLFGIPIHDNHQGENSVQLLTSLWR